MKVESDTLLEMMSVICTSTAENPAQSKAKAISAWPLTPCSRRIATRGLEMESRFESDVAKERTLADGLKVKLKESPGSEESSIEANSTSAH